MDYEFRNFLYNINISQKNYLDIKKIQRFKKN